VSPLASAGLDQRPPSSSLVASLELCAGVAAKAWSVLEFLAQPSPVLGDR
jgi:hypothetical protein